MSSESEPTETGPRSSTDSNQSPQYQLPEGFLEPLRRPVRIFDIRSSQPSQNPNPGTTGPRVRQTARKRVAIPVRATVAPPQPTVGEPSRQVNEPVIAPVLTGIPMMPSSGMTEEEKRRFHHMSLELYNMRGMLDYQTYKVSSCLDMADLNHHHAMQALEAAQEARRLIRLVHTCLVSGVVLMVLVGLVYFGFGR